MFDLKRVLAAYQQGEARARALARASSEWWMEELELNTDLALEEATLAVRSAVHGQLREALHHANWACAWERREYGQCPLWGPLRQAVRAVARQGQRRLAEAPC
jgi:hypothetical protein